MPIPRHIGRYEIVREIGRGAMGLVYLAHDPRIDRPVAIKTIRTSDALPASEAEEVRLRFVREARAAGRLQHPGIVTIFDVGEEAGGAYFIAMEYIEGETLESWTRPGSLLSPEQVTDLTAQACDALDYAHRNQVIHRDIKPGNLMLLAGGRLKITDFGLAKNPSASLTMEGVLIGTPNYMSPEQVTGKLLDGRTDLFSLGAVLYELLTGEKPFHGESVTTIIYKILHDTPRLTQAQLSQMPAGVAEVLEKALRKEPSERFQSGAEFAAALKRVARAAPFRVPAPDRRPPGGGVSALSIFGSVALVLLAPARATEDDRWGRGREDGRAPLYETAAIMAGPAMPKPAAERPAETRQIAIATEPPGARIYLDDVEVEGGVVSLPPDDRGRHVLVAESDCFIETRELKPGEAGPVTIPLKTPKAGALRVSSEPRGAAISLDGRETGRRTPAEIPVSLCDTHAVTLSLAGYKDAKTSVTGVEAPVDLKLARLPEGLLRVQAPYAVEILEKGKKLGGSGAPLKLSAGAHTLTVRNSELFLDQELVVQIEADRTVTAGATLPAPGAINVVASPDNCTVFVNGRDVGVTPIDELRLVAGTYTIKAVYNPTQESQEQRVDVRAGSTARVKFKFQGR